MAATAPRVRAAVATVALAAGLGGCGGGPDEPARTLAPGTLTVGAVVVSARDRVIANGARIAIAEVNDAGGIEGKVRPELVGGADAAKLVRGGARVLILPCEAGGEGRAVGALRGQKVVTFTTCNNDPEDRGGAGTPLSAPWAIGPSVADRAAMVAAALHDRQSRRVRIVAGGAADFLEDAVEAWDIDLVDQDPDAIATDGGWGRVGELRGLPVYGLDRLDTAAGIDVAGAGAEGRVFATFGFPSPGTELDELYEKYRLEYGARPDGSHVQLGYDAVRVLVEAVEEAKSTDPEALSGALPGLDVRGASGILTYDEDGSRQPDAVVALVEVRGGRMELVERGRPQRPDR